MPTSTLDTVLEVYRFAIATWSTRPGRIAD